MDEGLRNLEKHNNKVDYIITHSPTSSLMNIMDGGTGLFETDYLTDYLEKISQSTEYSKWYFGHMHVDHVFKDNRSTGLYRSIIVLPE